MKATIEKPLKSKRLPEELFPAIANERGAVWLDSSLQIGDKGRYSFLARRPVIEISAAAINLREILHKLNRHWQNKSLFSIGYISYEGALQIAGVPLRSLDGIATPLLHFLFYDSVLCFDHFTGQVAATKSEADDYSDLFDNSLKLTESFPRNEIEIHSTVSKNDYLEHIRRIKEHIKEGDIYQANYTCRFDIRSDANPFLVYQNLRRLNPAPYSAYLNFGDYQIISSSPERMFKRAADFITSCPIKGTVPSGKGALANERRRQELLNSAKDKAELLMIVDLMRNDLGKIARTGSVEVSNLFTAEPYSSLIHLVADVSASLKEGIGYLEIFSSLLPGGSITGAPKKRAIEILQEQENTPRGVYTGCIGYVHGDRADFNIAIRTIFHGQAAYQVHSGGGIVADSDPENEYQEMQLKAGNLFKALGAEMK